MKLITDTCSAIKLLAFGDKLFRPGVIQSGDLVIHSRVFRETSKWDKTKKQKYKVELALLAQIGNKGQSFAVPRSDSDAYLEILKATIEANSLSVGPGDMEQLISAIYHQHHIITDDGHFNKLVGIMDIGIFDAEDIVLEAKELNVLTQAEINQAKILWKKNNEKMLGKI